MNIFTRLGAEIVHTLNPANEFAGNNGTKSTCADFLKTQLFGCGWG